MSWSCGWFAPCSDITTVQTATARRTRPSRLPGRRTSQYSAAPNHPTTVTASHRPNPVGSTRWSLVATSRPAPIARRSPPSAHAITTPRRAGLAEMTPAEATRCCSTAFNTPTLRLVRANAYFAMEERSLSSQRRRDAADARQPALSCPKMVSPGLKAMCVRVGLEDATTVEGREVRNASRVIGLVGSSSLVDSPPAFGRFLLRDRHVGRARRVVPLTSVHRCK